MSVNFPLFMGVVCQVLHRPENSDKNITDFIKKNKLPQSFER